MSVPEVLSTSVDARHRTISQFLETGDSARFALVRRPNGDVHWSYDLFRRESPGMPWEWAEHGGRLTVDQVAAHLPACRRDVLRWTAEEIEDGADAVTTDLFARDVRRRALERLAAELHAAQLAA